MESQLRWYSILVSGTIYMERVEGFREAKVHYKEELVSSHAVGRSLNKNVD